MEELHHTKEVVTVDQHATDRCMASMETISDNLEQPVIRTSERVSGEGEEDRDFTSILLPVDSKERRVLLRRAGVLEIDSREKEECREVRLSRQVCGCQCELYCLPDSCPCIRSTIKCQVDRPGFPCNCTAESCLNKSGRLEFNPVKVRTHFVRTIMRTRLEAARYLPSGSLGYLAHSLYSQQEMASTSNTPHTSHWLPGSWWAFSHTQSDLGDTGEEVQEESGSSDSDEDLYTEVVEDEEEEEVQDVKVVEENLAKNDQSVSTSERDVTDILDTVIQSVIPEEPEGDVEDDDHDEGISSDSCYEDPHTDKSEEDSIDRSEGFGDDISEDKIEFSDRSDSCQYSGPEKSLSHHPAPTMSISETERCAELRRETLLLSSVPA